MPQSPPARSDQARRCSRESAVPDVVEFRREGAIAVITVNHPPVNALNNAMRKGLVAALDRARDDAEVQGRRDRRRRPYIHRGRRHHRIQQAADEPHHDRRDRNHRRDAEAGGRGPARHPARRRARGRARLPFPRCCGRNKAWSAGNQARPDAGRRRHPAAAAPDRHGQGDGDDPVRRPDRGRRCQVLWSGR